MIAANQTHEQRALFIRGQLPPEGLFAGQSWRISPTPFALGTELLRELDSLGRVLFQFYRAVNLLYRRSLEGKQPAWVAQWLDQGKPADLIALQRSPALRNDLPRVIRPDLLLTEEGFAISELDSVPGGIGLTAWLNRTYSALETRGERREARGESGAGSVIGGSEGMISGFASIFGAAPRTHIVVSEESATYRPEMEWLGSCLRPPSTSGGAAADAGGMVRSASFLDFADGDAVYRFFELFDLANVPNHQRLFELAAEKRIRLTPPPKPIFEEKMLLALLWNRNLQGFWRQELGEGFLNRLLKAVPYTWLVDPTPLPPHAAIPELGLTDWQQLKSLSQRERDLILKISGFSEEAWGARGVYLGSDLSTADWSLAVDKALASWPHSPYILQRYHKPRVVESAYFDFQRRQMVPMPGRVRLCPYYFVSGENDAARAQLGGVLATICPADKKIIHGMREAILVPCGG